MWVLSFCLLLIGLRRLTYLVWYVCRSFTILLRDTTGMEALFQMSSSLSTTTSAISANVGSFLVSFLENLVQAQNCITCSYVGNTFPWSSDGFPNTGHFTATRVFIVDEDDVDEAVELEGAFAIFKQCVAALNYRFTNH